MADEKQDKKLIVSSNKKFKLEEIPVNTGPAGTAGTQIVARGKGGKFVKREETRIDPKTVIQRFRTAMLSTDEKGLCDLEEIYESMMTIIREGCSDPKMAMAATKAAEFLMNRTWGKPDPSDEVMDAQKMSGVKVVVINQQPLEKPAKEFQPVEKPEPKFLEAEITTNK